MSFNALVLNPRKSPLVDHRGAHRSSDAAFKTRWISGTSADEHVKRIVPFVRMGIDELAILSTRLDEEKFLDLCGKKMILYLRDTFGNKRK